MQFKKSRAILSAVLATAMASSALLTVAASAERTAEEHFGDETYAQRFASLYYDVVTKGTDNGYLSKDGVPYHAVEEVIIEAPDYGHETTSEAMSYIVTVGAMYDNIANKGIVDGMSKGELAKAWKILEALIPSADQQGGRLLHQHGQPHTAFHAVDQVFGPVAGETDQGFKARFPAKVRAQLIHERVLADHQQLFVFQVRDPDARPFGQGVACGDDDAEMILRERYFIKLFRQTALIPQKREVDFLFP